MANLAVVGCGYVGAVSAACFAKLGHTVHCIDLDSRRIASLRAGVSPIHEPGLDELLRLGIEGGLLHFYDAYPDVLDADIVFVAVNTPGSSEGAADLRGVRMAVSQIAACVRPGTIIVNKSTVPIGTGELVEEISRRHGPDSLAVVSNPEFLREGSAVWDFLHPDRVVIGASEEWASERLANLYEPLGAPVMRVDVRTAEMIKYASNAFLAAKISFINEIATICEALGADVEEVARGMGMDRRIGSQFLRAGLGWGGSCFPKDVRALAHMAAVHGAHPQLLRSVMDINADQRLRTVQKVLRHVGNLEGKRVAVLGATFKAHTDDTRNSPAIELANLLFHEGADVVVYDPVVGPERMKHEIPHAKTASSLAEAVAGAEAVVIATDWPEFVEMDLMELRSLVSNPLIVDARNCLDPDDVARAGFTYECIGRPKTVATAVQPVRAPVPVGRG